VCRRSSHELADTLADEVGGVAVVELFSESLGDTGSGGATYLEMIRTNAERIADALAA
jgi:zinc/manganese transport system substrate-binding protein